MKKQRCFWASQRELNFSYHDREWGRPVHDEHRHFEMLTLEGAQAGLSWETVLAKRERYREVFHHFDPVKVSKMTKASVNKLVKDPGIIRHRGKIESTISNAKAFLAIQKEFGSFDKYIWAFVDNKPIINTFKKPADYPSNTNISTAIAKDLKKRDFKFVGTTIVYAYMQAAGICNDHSVDCFLHGKKLKALD